MANRDSPIKLVTRTRDKWKNKARPKSIEENAVATAYIIWQLALNGAKNLHVEDFHFDSDEQRIRVIEEYLAFLVHLSDRLMFESLNSSQRKEFVLNVAGATARHLQRNKEEILGRGDYRTPYLSMVDRRSSEYSACALDKDGPGYQMLRIIGSNIQSIMGYDQTNKWVIDQVMENDAPGMFRKLEKSVMNLSE